MKDGDSRALAEDAFQAYVDLDRQGRAPEVETFLEDQPSRARPELRRMIADYTGLRDLLGETTFTLKPGRVLGDFKLVREIGRGGMALIWEAEQRGLGRAVALKLLHPQYSISEESLTRFRREAEACARIQHPDIVAVHTVGEAEGLHYIAQELVGDGCTLADSLAEFREGELPPDYYERVAELFALVADALQAAHEQGVVHRDVKPSNILITDDDRPKVADFGLAMIQDELGLSRTGQLVGTPFYMSPEQAASKRMGIDHRTDVFSLGATMFEALTLRRPFDGDTSQQVLGQILVEDPPDPRSVRSRCPAELAVICMKALEKSPDRRYGTAGEMAADLRRWGRNEPISARPPHLGQRLGKWTRRHPVWSVAGGVGLVAFVMISVLLIATLRAKRDAADRADDADRFGKDAVAAAKRARDSERLAIAQAARWTTLSAGELLRNGEVKQARATLEKVPGEHRGWEWHCVLDRLSVVHTDLIGHAAEISAVVFDATGRRLASASDDGEIIFWDLDSSSQVLSIEAHEGPISALAFGPTADTILSTGLDGRLRSWDTSSGDRLREADLGVGPLVSVDLDPAGASLVVMGLRDCLFLDNGWEVTRSVGLTHPGLMDFDPVERRLAIIENENVWLFDAPPVEDFELRSFGNVLRELDASTLQGRRIRFALAIEVDESDGEGSAKPWIRLDTADGTTRILRNNYSEPVRESPWHEHEVQVFVDSSVTRLVFGVMVDGVARVRIDDVRLGILDSTDASEPFYDDFEGDPSQALAGWTVIDGTVAEQVEGGTDRGARCVQLRASQSGFLGFHNGVAEVGFSDDGRFLGSVSNDGTLRLWDAGERVVLRDYRGQGTTACIAFSPAGDLLATGTVDGSISIQEVRTGRIVRTFAWSPHAVWDLEFSPDGEELAAAFSDNVVRVISVSSTRRLGSLGNAPLAYARAGGEGEPILGLVDPGGNLGPTSYELVECGATRNDPARRIRGAGIGGANAVTVSADGSRFAACLFAGLGGTEDWEVVVWDSPGGDVVLREQVSATPLDIALSVTGDRVAYSTSAGRVRVVDVETRAASELELRWEVFVLGFDPRSNWIGFGNREGEIGFWDPRSAADSPQMTWRAHDGLVIGLEASPDGRFVASCGQDGSEYTFRLWRLPEGEPVELTPPPQPVGQYGFGSQLLHPFAFLDGSRRLAIASNPEGRIRIYDLESGALTLALDPKHDGPIVGLAGIDQGETLLSIGADWSVETFAGGRVPAARTPGSSAEVDAYLDGLFEELFTSRRVIRAIRADARIDQAFRERAVVAAGARGVDYGALSLEVWDLACPPEGAPEAYERAAAISTAVMEELGDREPAWFHLHAMAQYRVGKLDEALRAIEASIEELGGAVSDWAFLAMIHHRQGRPEEASAALGDFKRVLQEARYRDRRLRDLDQLLSEVEDLLGRDK